MGNKEITLYDGKRVSFVESTEELAMIRIELNTAEGLLLNLLWMDKDTAHDFADVLGEMASKL